MTEPDFTTSILVSQAPSEAFKAVTDVRGWWSEEIEGGTEKPGDVFDYHYEDINLHEDVHRCKIKIIEVVPNEKIVWYVLENYFKFTKDETEWKDTRVVFNIAEEEGKTRIRMTHVGLVPEYECFEICKGAWTNYIQNSLSSLIETGKGHPNAKGKPQTEDERRLVSGE